MDMDILMEEFSASNDQMIVKRKRTKRLRQSSSTSSSGGGGGGGRGGEFSYNSLASSSPMSTSSGISTEEDEDMANCLILLARGGLSEEIKPPASKFSSRKLAEMATADGKVGIYLYECKTCSRSFPSFQALGGHRASHRKPKTAADADRKKSPPPDGEERKFAKFNPVTPSISSQLPKIHECSICGSEFASGQALGGHMRRHRPAVNGTTTRSGDVCTSTIEDSDKKARNMLELDLNLPAPPEDERRGAEFDQFSSNQQARLVFSAAALVDCHY